MNNKEALGWRIGYLNKEEEDNTCHVCNGRGYHIETDIDYDGSRSRVKISCYCCDGKGVK